MPESTPSNVQIGSHSIPIRAPGSVSARWCVLSACGRNRDLGAVAALGVAWAGPRLKTRYQTYDDFVAYGAAVLDEVTARLNVKAIQVVRAGHIAFAAYPVDDLVETEEEVKAQETFTEDPAATTS